MAISEQRYQDALNILRPIPTEDSRYNTQVVELMMECFEDNENILELIDAVGQMHADHPSGEIIRLVSGMVRKNRGLWRHRDSFRDHFAFGLPCGVFMNSWC